MILASSHLTGWWIGYAIGIAVVVVVALLALGLIVTARRIGTMAEEATRSIVTARDRTEALWATRDTNLLAHGILEGAIAARRALGGEIGEPADVSMRRAGSATTVPSDRAVRPAGAPQGDES